MTIMNYELTSVVLQGGIPKPKQNNVLSACRSLVKTDHRPATGLNFFALQHDAVRDYLKDQPEYSESDCHLTAADRCLRMMKFASFTSAGHSPEQRFFHWYANRFWPLHYQKIDFTLTGEDKPLAEERLKGFDHVRESLKKFVMQGHKTSPAFNKWLKQIPDYIENLGKNHPLSQQLFSLQASVVTALHAISVFGFADLIDAHSKQFDFSQRNAYGHTALILAIDNSQVDTVKALIASDRVDVNQFNLRAVQQLLEQNFEPVISYASALQAAAVKGSRAIFDLLISRGAKKDLVAGYYGSILQAACLKGHAKLVEYLLDEHNLDPNSQGGYHGNSLQAACAMGHFEIVQILLGAEKSDVSVLAPGGHYGSAIMAATCAGSPEIVESLLYHTDDAETMANQRSPKYGTPLQQAADLNRKDLVDLLIGHGANINALGATEGDTSQKDSSALANAARKGNQKIVSMLVEMKAEADFSCSDGQFHLLHQAALHNMLDLARYCVEKKCDINVTTDQGVKYHQDQRKMTPLAIASVEGHMEIVELLLGEGARIQYPGDDVSTLILAASRDQAEIVEVLIQQHKARHLNNPKSTIDFINRRVPSSKNTALHEAARLGAVCAVAKLLEHKASFLRAEFGVGVFQRAAWDGKPQVVKTLVEHLERSSKAESVQAINALDDNGKSALIDAAERNRFNIFPYLLEHGADFKVRDKRGNTLLHYISTRNHHDLARMLLAAWDKEDPGGKMAWLAMTNDEKRTGLQEAVRRHHYSTIRILLDAGATITPTYDRYCLIFEERPRIDEIQNLIEEGFGDHREEALKYFNHRAQDGASILHDVARWHRLDIAQYLLKNGADPTTLDAESMLDLQRVDTATPLHLAVCGDFQPMVRLLLECAAQQCDKSKFARFINRRNRLGKTALMDAAERNQFEIMDVLLSKPYSADWFVVDNQEQNALHWCAWRHHTPSVEVLLRHASGADQSPIGGNRFAAFLKQRSKAGLTPLHDVTHQGFEDLARMLLYDYHADYEAYDNTGDSILHRAVQTQHDFLLIPYLEYMAKDKDQEKFKRVLHHRNTSMDRTVLDALEARDRKGWADYVRKFGA